MTFDHLLLGQIDISSLGTIGASQIVSIKTEIVRRDLKDIKEIF
jgi:hypothetical protein